MITKKQVLDKFLKNTFIKTVRETEDGVSFIVNDNISDEDFYYKLVWEENSIKLVVGGLVVKDIKDIYCILEQKCIVLVFETSTGSKNFINLTDLSFIENFKIMDTKDINWDVRWVNHGLESISTSDDINRVYD